MTDATALQAPASTGQMPGLAAAAAAAAAGRIPSPVPLAPGVPGTDTASAPPADGSGHALTARLAGGGDVAVIVADDVVEALHQSPLGALEFVPALTPALEAAAAALGATGIEAARELTPELAVESLRTRGRCVVVPLLAGGEQHGSVVVAFAAPGARAERGGTVREGLDLLRDVEMQVTAELGRTRMTVRDLLSLAPGAVVELDRAAGSPADLLVNGTLVARGEVVVVDEDYGIRISEIVTTDGDAAR